jgi:hypothetical protein
MKRLGLILSCVLLTSSVQARFHVASGPSNFEHYLEQYDYTIVCFSESADYKILQNRMIAASNYDEFKHLLRKRIAFVMVNVSKDAGKKIAAQFNIQVFPSLVVFDHHMPRAAQAKAPATAKKITQMLYKFFGKDIDKMVLEERAHQDKAHAQTVPTYYGYNSSAYLWDYPYSQWGVAPYGVTVIAADRDYL